MTEAMNMQQVPSIEALAADPRMQRIERDHAFLGAAFFVSGLLFGSVAEATSLAFGWAVIAASLWVWKRVALLLFAGDSSAPGALGVRVVVKSVLTILALVVVVPLIDLQLLPMLLGGVILPAVLLIEALRTGLGVATPAQTHGPAA